MSKGLYSQFLTDVKHNGSHKTVCLIGTYIWLFLYGVHHNSAVWENPEEFDPNRFAPENSQGRHSHAFVPFSAGPRYVDLFVVNAVLSLYKDLMNTNFKQVKLCYAISELLVCIYFFLVAAYKPFFFCRNCIGQHFALNELKIVAAHVLKNFHVELDPERTPRKYVSLVLRSKDGVWLKVKPL